VLLGTPIRVLWLEDRRKAIRQLAAAACADVEDPLGRSLAALLAEPDIQLELSGLVLASFGVAPARRKAPAEANKRSRANKKRAPRKPVAGLSKVVPFLGKSVE
jgi:hypothetical protein